MRRDPALWVGFRTRRGVEYVGRQCADARAVTYDDDWYLRAGTDRDGVRLFRRPYVWEWRWRRPPSHRLEGKRSCRVDGQS